MALARRIAHKTFVSLDALRERARTEIVSQKPPCGWYEMNHPVKSYKDLTRRRIFRSPIVTELVPLTEFYPAEPHHQDYYRNHRGSAYSDIHIVPKLRKLEQKLK